jgi:hypothetical protein
MVAQLLLGCGGSPLFTLGTTYIDNHVKRDSSSVYIGFMYSMCAFGPVCGFLLGAFLLSHHVDTFSYDVSQLSIGEACLHERYFLVTRSRFPDFSRYNLPKREKICEVTLKLGSLVSKEDRRKKLY